LNFALLAPSVSKMMRAWDGAQQVQNNLQIAFALEWYKRDNGSYPKKLEALSPKYLKQIPDDIFSGKPLIYRPSEKGYLLYSVGYYGKDEGGRGLEDDPIGWNISVRMPLPELPPK
jgi:type II secretory pathway pseudopilin PulG